MNKFMKKTISVATAAVMALGCAACTPDSTVSSTSDVSITASTVGNAVTEFGSGYTAVIQNAGTLDEDSAFSEQEAAKTVIQAAEEGMVLLRNEGDALPLTSSDTVAVFGTQQFFKNNYSYYGYHITGAGSGNIFAEFDSEVYSPIVSIREKANEGKFKLYEPIAQKYKDDFDRLWADYTTYTPYTPSAEDLNKAKADGVNKAIFFVSRLEGESSDEERGIIDNDEIKNNAAPDNAIEKGQWYLSNSEEAMIKTLSETFDKVIVVVNTGNLMDTNWVKEGKADAVLCAWYGGIDSGKALANILSGDATPSGKLTETAADINNYPTTENIMKMFEDGGFYDHRYTSYTEDIFVGYRYFETFTNIPVNFEFGFGLSYTEFDISDLKYSESDGNITVSAKITNIGDKYSGKEVFQVYFSAPQMNVGEAKLSKPAKELAGFVKTKLLAPSESEIVSVTFPVSEMSSYDDTGVTATKSAYVLEAGDYKIYAGNSVRKVELAGTYNVGAFTIVEQLSEKMAPKDLALRLLANGEFEALKSAEFKELDTTPVSDFTPPEEDAPVVFDDTVTYGDVLSGKNTLDELVSQFTIDELASFALRQVVEGSAGHGLGGFGGNESVTEKYGVPLARGCDGPISPPGLRQSTGHSFPSGMVIGCSFNIDLAADLGIIAGKVHDENPMCELWLAPGMNIMRSPLCGRNFEYYSEDPLVSGLVASAVIYNTQKFDVGVSVKHFAVNNKELNRVYNDSRLSERALREIYLRGFEMVVKEADPVSIMSSYNLINGYSAGHATQLLRGIAREEWGFDGLYLSDWGGSGGYNLVEAIHGGNNVWMGTENDSYQELVDAYNNGIVSRELLEENAKYVIGAMLEINLPEGFNPNNQ